MEFFEKRKLLSNIVQRMKGVIFCTFTTVLKQIYLLELRKNYFYFKIAPLTYKY